MLVDEEAAAASGKVAVGAMVEIEDEAGERMEVEISSVGGVSPVSPLGKALIGAAVGDLVHVEAPQRRLAGARALDPLLTRILSVAQARSRARARSAVSAADSRSRAVLAPALMRGQVA